MGTPTKLRDHVHIYPLVYTCIQRMRINKICKCTYMYTHEYVDHVHVHMSIHITTHMHARHKYGRLRKHVRLVAHSGEGILFR